MTTKAKRHKAPRKQAPPEPTIEELAHQLYQAVLEKDGFLMLAVSDSRDGSATTAVHNLSIADMLVVTKTIMQGVQE